MSAAGEVQRVAGNASHVRIPVSTTRSIHPDAMPAEERFRVLVGVGVLVLVSVYTIPALAKLAIALRARPRSDWSGVFQGTVTRDRRGRIRKQGTFEGDGDA